MTLADVVSLQRGTTYKSSLLNLPGPVLLGLASIERDGGFRGDSLRTYGGDSPDKLILRPGDVYVSLKDVTQSGDLLGAVSRVPAEVGLGRLTQDTVKLTFIRGDVSPQYIYWVLRTPQYRSYCRAHAIGTTNLSLAREDFLGLRVPEPTPARLALVDLLESIDHKIGLNRLMNRTLERIMRALYAAHFGQPKFPLPSGWRHSTLGTVAEINVRKRGAEFEHSEIEYVDISSVQVGRLMDTTRLPLNEAPSRAQRLVRNGDTIWSCVRPNRRSYLFIHDPPPNIVISTGFAVLSPLGVPASFLYASVTTEDFVEYLTANADGSAYPAVRPDHFARAEVVVPPEADLQAFDSLAAPTLARVAANARESRTLTALRDALLPRLISGEIRISDERGVSPA